MTTDYFCFYLQNRLNQTSQTGGELYSDTSPLVFPGTRVTHDNQNIFIEQATGENPIKTFMSKFTLFL